MHNPGRVSRAVGLGFSRFVRHYYGNRFFSSGYVRCFSSPAYLRKLRSPPITAGGLPHSEISGSACKRLPGAYRSVTTSFFGPGCLGIHHLPFLACIALPFSRLPPPLTGLLPARGGQVAERRAARSREALSYQALSCSAFMVTHFTFF